jgi:hypothetical protein
MKQNVSCSSFVTTTYRLCTDFSFMFTRVHTREHQQQAFRCTSLAQQMYNLYELLERTVLKLRFKGDIRTTQRTIMTSSKHVWDHLVRVEVQLYTLLISAPEGGGWSTPRPRFTRERPRTRCTGGWVGPRSVWTCAKNHAPTGIRSPDHPARSQSLHRLSYPSPARSSCKGNYLFPSKIKTWLHGVTYEPIPITAT